MPRARRGQQHRSHDRDRSEPWIHYFWLAYVIPIIFTFVPGGQHHNRANNASYISADEDTAHSENNHDRDIDNENVLNEPLLFDDIREVPARGEDTSESSARAPMLTNNLQRSNLKSYQVYSSRYYVLIIFCFMTFTSAFMWISFAPIVSLVKEFYGVSDELVNRLSLIYMFLHLPGSLFAIYSINKRGLRKSVLMGAVIMTIGGWIRYCSIFAITRTDGDDSEDSTSKHNMAYNLLFIGQLLSAIVAPMFTTIPAKLAGEWFPCSERDNATTVGALAYPIGIAIAQFLPTLLVTCFGGTSDNAVTPNEIDQENQTREIVDCLPSNITGIGTLLLLQAVVSTLVVFLAFLFFAEQPPSPPSHSAALRKDIRLGRITAGGVPHGSNQNHGISGINKYTSPLQMMFSDLSQLLRNIEFLKLICGVGIGGGMFNAMITLLAQFIRPLYYDSNGELDEISQSIDAGRYGATVIGSGVVSAAIISCIITHNHRYREFLKGLFVMSGIASVIMFTQMVPNNQFNLMLCFTLMGMSMMPVLPVSMQIAVECTYPVSEESSTALMGASSQIVGVVAIRILENLLSPKDGTLIIYNSNDSLVTPTSFFFIGAIGIALVPVLSFRGEFRRLTTDSRSEGSGPIDNLEVLEFNFDEDGGERGSERALSMQSLMDSSDPEMILERQGSS